MCCFSQKMWGPQTIPNLLHITPITMVYDIYKYMYIWLVVWNIFLFSHILGIIIPTDFHIFQKGWNHPPDMYIYIYNSSFHGDSNPRNITSKGTPHGIPEIPLQAIGRRAVVCHGGAERLRHPGRTPGRGGLGAVRAGAGHLGGSNWKSSILKGYNVEPPSYNLVYKPQ